MKGWSYTLIAAFIMRSSGVWRNLQSTKLTNSCFVNFQMISHFFLSFQVLATCRTTEEPVIMTIIIVLLQDLMRGETCSTGSAEKRIHLTKQKTLKITELSLYCNRKYLQIAVLLPSKNPSCAWLKWFIAKNCWSKVNDTSKYDTCYWRLSYRYHSDEME